MKPRSKREKMFVEMAGKLPLVNKKRILKGVFSNDGFYKKKGEVWCHCCGHIEQVSKPELSVSIGCETHTCSACGTILQLHHDRNFSESSELESRAVLTTFRGFNVLRMFHCHRVNRAGSPTEYSVHEVYQIWIDDQGREVITGCRIVRSFGHEKFDYTSDFSIKHRNESFTGDYYYSDIYAFYGNYVDKRYYRVTPTLLRNGFDIRMLDKNCEVSTLLRQLLTNPAIEALAKQKQFSLVGFLSYHAFDEELAHLGKICSRHGYIIENAIMWTDYVQMLEELGLDTHNPHYLCPADLKQAHDWAVERIRKRDEAMILEDLRAEESDYEDSHGRFFGLAFGDGMVEAHVIGSVREMKQEGDTMHHCVYSAGYYKRGNSLILSVRDKENNRLETVEVDLATMSVAQSRGKFNQPTDYHEEIVQLMNDNMDLIKQRM